MQGGTKPQTQITNDAQFCFSVARLVGKGRESVKGLEPLASRLESGRSTSHMDGSPTTLPGFVAIY